MYIIYLVAALSVFLQFGSARLIPLSLTTLSTLSSRSSSHSVSSLSSTLRSRFPSIPSSSTRSSTLSSPSSSLSSISSTGVCSTPLSSLPGKSGTWKGSCTSSSFRACSTLVTAATSSPTYSTPASIRQSHVRGFRSEPHSAPVSPSSPSSIPASSAGHFPPLSTLSTNGLCDYPHSSFDISTAISSSSAPQTLSLTSRVPSTSASSTPLTSTFPLSANALSTASLFSSTRYQQSTSAPLAGTDSFTGFTGTASTIDTSTGLAPTGSLLTAFSSMGSLSSAAVASTILSAGSASISVSLPMTSPSAETFASSEASYSWSSTRSVISAAFSSTADPSSLSQFSSSTSPSATATLADFETVICNSSDVGNPAADPSVRWAEAKCDDAWAAVTQDWTTVPGAQSLIFVQYVSEYWDGPQQWNCGKMGEDPCGGGPGDCGDMDDIGPVGTPNMPAGWLFLQSFTNFHNVSIFSRSVLVILISCQPTISANSHNTRCHIAW